MFIPKEPVERGIPCEYCTDLIHEDETYWDLDGTIICHHCVDSLTAQDVLEFLGYKAQKMPWHKLER